MLTAQPCRHCGEPTYLDDRICAVCADPPHDSGRFRCCAGVYPEHLAGCLIGETIASARRTIAHAGVTRSKSRRVAL